jgi:hypothetical protein
MLPIVIVLSGFLYTKLDRSTGYLAGLGSGLVFIGSALVAIAICIGHWL